MPIRCLFAASLFLATAATSAEEPAAVSPPAEATPPAIEIVREGDGVADVWRREGVDFPAYGPDGAPVVPTLERQALQALARAYDVQFVALALPEDAVAAACAGECVGGLAVRVRAPVNSIGHYRLAKSIGDSWLRDPATAGAACVPEYRHALTYSADGHAWEVLLDYACGRYRLRRDGVQVGEGFAGAPSGLAEFDALLASAGVAAAPSDAGSATAD